MCRHLEGNIGFQWVHRLLCPNEKIFRHFGDSERICGRTATWLQILNTFKVRVVHLTKHQSCSRFNAIRNRRDFIQSASSSKVLLLFNQQTPSSSSSLQSHKKKMVNGVWSLSVLMPSAVSHMSERPQEAGAHAGGRAYRKALCCRSLPGKSHC